MIMAELAASAWTSAVDSASGRTYYVNLKTRVTRWALPGDEEADTFVKEHLGGGAPVASKSATMSTASISSVVAPRNQKVVVSPPTGGGEQPPQHLDSAVLTVDGLFSAVDVDGSGEISFDEFVEFWRGRQRAVGKQDDGTVAQMRSIFGDLDEDGSGARCHTRTVLFVVPFLRRHSCQLHATLCFTARNAGRKPDYASTAVDHAFEQATLIVLSSRQLWSSSRVPNGSLPRMLQAAACITCTRRHARRGGFHPMMPTQVGSSLSTSEVRLTAARRRYDCCGGVRATPAETDGCKKWQT